MSALAPCQIGSVRVETPLALGPMAGVTDRPFRVLCKEQGAGLLVTEMVSAKAILYRNQRTDALMAIDPSEHPISVQLFGSEPEVVAEAAVMIEEKPFDILDFNMGCPVPKVVNNGEGSALLRDPARAAAIIEAVVRRIKKPVSVKIRKGFTCDEVNAVEVAKRLEQAGAAMIAVHGRTRSQFYAGSADWDIIRQVKEAVRIPVFGNGDVNTPQAASSMREETGADGIMVARGAEGNPWLFREIRQYLETGELPARPDTAEIYDTILRHTALLTEEKGAHTALREMRKHIAWYTAGLPGAAALRRRINQAENFADMQALLRAALLHGETKEGGI